VKDLITPEELARIFGIPAKIITQVNKERYAKMCEGWTTEVVDKHIKEFNK